MRTTENTPVLFLTRAPAWERGIELDQTLAGSVVRTRAGYEQRIARQVRSTWRMTYSAVLAEDDAAARALRGVEEIRSAVVVPFWPEMATVQSTWSGNTVLIDRRSTPDWFAVGDYVFFDDGTDQQFRTVSAVDPSNDQRLTFAAMSGAIEFAPLSRVYPCRLCLRAGGTAEREVADRHSTLEKLSFVTL